MSEHMSRPAGVPTLTDHFKQALSMTRSQMQSGPSPLQSASQMGVNGLTSAVGVAPPLTHHTLPNTAVYGSQLNASAAPPTCGNDISSCLQSYGKWMLIIGILLVGVGGFYIWWRKRKSKETPTPDDGTRRPLNRPSFMSMPDNNRPNWMATTLIPPPDGAGASERRPSSQPFDQRPSSSFVMSTPPENLRDNEQHTVVRGAEFANPNVMSHMIPMSTRLSPQQSQQQPPMPQPQYQAQQPSQQPQPQYQTQQPSQQSQPPQPQYQTQPSQPPQPINIPISSTPSQQQQQPQPIPIQLPISSPPSQLPIADPNFTAV